MNMHCFQKGIFECNSWKDSFEKCNSILHKKNRFLCSVNFNVTGFHTSIKPGNQKPKFKNPSMVGK